MTHKTLTGSARRAADSAQQGTESAQRTARKTPVGRFADELPTDRLVTELQDLVGALGTRALDSVIGKIDDATDRLTDYAAKGGGPGLLAALTGAGGKTGDGKGSRMRSLLGSGLGALGGTLKSTVAGGATGDDRAEDDGGVVKGALGGAVQGAVGGALKAVTGRGKGKGGKLKVTNIVETVDVGVPVRLAYDQWTSFQQWPNFTKKVESVEQGDDERLTWKAQVFWSHREWESTIVEQIPDRHIVWRSKGPKGYVDGAVTFHELGPELTRIVVVLEYHPQGFFERTGNLWRAQGRRARLELKHFQRHVMTRTLLHPEETEGWRGEIRDGEVVKDHETALREEGRAEDRGEPEAVEEEAEEHRPSDVDGEAGVAEEETGEGASEPVDEEADEGEPEAVDEEADEEDGEDGPEPVEETGEPEAAGETAPEEPEPEEGEPAERPSRPAREEPEPKPRRARRPVVRRGAQPAASSDERRTRRGRRTEQ